MTDTEQTADAPECTCEPTLYRAHRVWCRHYETRG